MQLFCKIQTRVKVSKSHASHAEDSTSNKHKKQSIGGIIFMLHHRPPVAIQLISETEKQKATTRLVLRNRNAAKNKKPKTP
jgi:hypothetical protein